MCPVLGWWLKWRGIVQVVLLGNSLSGKTCLMHRFLNNKFMNVTQSVRCCH